MPQDQNRALQTEKEQATPSRRAFLQGALCCVATAPLAASGAADPPAVSPKAAVKPTMAGTGRPGSIAGINPKNVVEGYRSRQLGELSDRQLVRGVSAVISRPGRGLTSFTLHAPLELLARAGLLPLVAPEDRELARLQMVASAAAYGQGVQVLPDPAPLAPFADLGAATRRFAGVFAEGDEDGLEAVVLQMARQFGVASLVHALTPRLLPTLTSASHAHIGLWLLLRHGEAGDLQDAALLRAAARRLAADPKGRLASFAGMKIEGTRTLAMGPEKIEQEILAKLANPPKGKKPSSFSIRPLMEAAENSTTIEDFFADFIRRDLTTEQIDAAFRAVLRVCAHAMLQDTRQQAKFGWSHCLTLPQAASGLSSLNLHRKLGLATTLVWVMAYRTILSDRALDFSYRPKPFGGSLREALETGPEAAAGRFWHADPREVGEMQRILASEAAVRNDQHLVKYTRACFDLCGFDPTSWRLYYASAATLSAIWIVETPRQKIADHFLDGRSTPA